MLIGVVVVFLVCQMPQALQHTYVVYLSADITLKVIRAIIAVFPQSHLIMMDVTISALAFMHVASHGGGDGGAKNKRKNPLICFSLKHSYFSFFDA